MVETETKQIEIKVAPYPGGQRIYFGRREFEVLFGGEAGPGKSWALVYDALGLQFKAVLGKAAIEFRDYRAVLFRRQTTELTKLIDECKKLYEGEPLNAMYAQARRGEPGPSFTFPSGAKIFLCHLQLEDDKTNHHGLEYQYIGFDELTTFTFTQYLYMFHRCRSTIKGLWCRMRSTTNPVGPGLAWVKKRFIRNGNFQIEPYKTYWFIDDPGADSPEQNPMGLPVEPGTKFAVDRAFIPGYLEENLGIEDKDAYRARIMQMGKKYARALLQRDWDAFTGDFFDDFSEKLKIDPFMIPREWRLFGSLDPGWSKPCSFGLTSIDSNGGMWRLFTYYVSGQSPTAHAREIRERIAGFYYTGGRMPEYIVAGHDAFGAEKNTMTGENRTWYDIFAQQGLYLIKANTSRVPGWWAVNDAMRNLKLHFFKGYNAPLFDEITSAQHDEKDSEDIMGRGNDQSVPDHALDEMRYGVMSAYKPSKPIVEVQQMLPHWGIEPLSMRLYKDDPRNIWLPDDN